MSKLKRTTKHRHLEHVTKQCIILQTCHRCLNKAMDYLISNLSKTQFDINSSQGAWVNLYIFANKVIFGFRKRVKAGEVLTGLLNICKSHICQSKVGVVMVVWWSDDVICLSVLIRVKWHAELRRLRFYIALVQWKDVWIRNQRVQRERGREAPSLLRAGKQILSH